jgi:hypothetical protein
MIGSFESVVFQSLVRGAKTKKSAKVFFLWWLCCVRRVVRVVVTAIPLSLQQAPPAQV